MSDWEDIVITAFRFPSPWTLPSPEGGATFGPGNGRATASFLSDPCLVFLVARMRIESSDPRTEVKAMDPINDRERRSKWHEGFAAGIGKIILMLNALALFVVMDGWPILTGTRRAPRSFF